MKQFPLRSDRVSLAVTETGGHLSDVVFVLPGGRQVSPMHTAPWADEPLPEDTPPILRVLRGDFFCAPFGSSDLIPGETRVHGLACQRQVEPHGNDRQHGRRRAGRRGAGRNRRQACRGQAGRGGRLPAPHGLPAAAAGCRSATTPCFAPNSPLQLAFSPGRWR